MLDYFRPRQSGRPANSAQLKRPCRSPPSSFSTSSQSPSFFSIFCCYFVLHFFYFSLPPLLSLSCAHCLRVFPFSSIPPPLLPLVDVTPVEKAETQVVAAAAPRFISTTRSFRTFFFSCPSFGIFDFLDPSTSRRLRGFSLLDFFFSGRSLHDGDYLNFPQERAFFCSTPVDRFALALLHRKIRPSRSRLPPKFLLATFGRCATGY